MTRWLDRFSILGHFCLRPTAKRPSNYLSCSCCCSSSSRHLINFLLGDTSGVHFWFKSGCRPRTNPGLVFFGMGLKRVSSRFSRYRKFLRMVEQGVPVQYSIVPELMEVYERAPLLPRCRVAPDRVFLCRKVYESRQKRVLKNPN